jgi:hypothetical protein
MMSRGRSRAAKAQTDAATRNLYQEGAREERKEGVR